MLTFVLYRRVKPTRHRRSITNWPILMIDTLDMLSEKTKGNLTHTEREILENTLYNLKMAYVRIENDCRPKPVTQTSTPED